jgi:inositol phosphorylceramide mannosyltransferase catalytic subunit
VPVIPRILHQVWKTDALPLAWKDQVLSWRRHHPDWQFRIWSDEEAHALVAESFPDLLATYEGFTYDIQRADAIRYLILLRHGGIYADLDLECLRPIEPLLAGRSLVAGRAPSFHACELGRQEMVCNSFLAAAPGHPVLEALLRHLDQRREIVTHDEVLASTGPLFLSAMLDRYGSDDVVLLGSHVFSPFTNGSAPFRMLARGGSQGDAVRADALTSGSYGIHHYANSWVINLKGPLHNPEPFAVPGFRFHPGLDSRGYDLGAAGRDVPRLARLARADPTIQGFNTDGFLKYRLRPRRAWVTMPEAGGAEGLYVREVLGPTGRAAQALALATTGIGSRRDPRR